MPKSITNSKCFSGFISDCPSGKLKKEKVVDMYSMILPEGNAEIFVDHIFRIFDKDENGSIDFKEFMLATDMTTGGSAEERLRWAFKMYDKDGSGENVKDHQIFCYILCRLYRTGRNG